MRVGVFGGVEGRSAPTRGAAVVSRRYRRGMDYVRLGRTGLKVSRICLGMMSYGDPGWRDWVLDEDAARPFIRRAAEGGITFFDTLLTCTRSG